MSNTVETDAVILRVTVTVAVETYSVDRGRAAIEADDMVREHLGTCPELTVLGYGSVPLELIETVTA